jgi:AcrR family transcriptional regulator
MPLPRTHDATRPRGKAAVARPKSDIQERILEAAHQRFLAEGVDGASLRNIAKEADTSIGMVYYYYTTKEELFLAVVEETYQLILEDFEKSLSEGKTYRERMGAVYRRVGTLSARELQVVQLIVREALTSSERRQRLINRFLRGHIPLLLRSVLDGIESRELDSSIPPLIGMAVSLGIGAVPSLMLRAASERWSDMAQNEEIPQVMRLATGELLKQLPDQERFAEILTGITMRALGSRAEDKPVPPRDT